MPREIAIIIFTLFTVWLWREDQKFRPPFSRALWLPLMWLLLLGSRPLSWWVWFFFHIGGSSSDLDGNPVDRLFYSALIVSSLVIIRRRNVSWNSVFGGNTGFVLFYIFLAVTIVWAEYPIPTLKRWIKEVGAIPVLLIILSEPDPVEAVKVVFTRCAYVLFAYSVLLIKYIPELSRDYYRHSGLPEIHGIATQKNSLGESVMVFGLVVLWQLLDSKPKRLLDFFRAPNLQWIMTIVMGVWLLHQCNSQTSILCVAFGSLLLLSTKIRFIDDRRPVMVVLCLVAVPAFFLIDSVFHISESLLAMIGRNPTLTNRTEIWAAIESHHTDPIFGWGYMDFWDAIGPLQLNGDYVGLKTAHNGYLEIFLDGGCLGLFFLTIMLLSVGINQSRNFVRKRPLGALGFAFFCMTLLNNVTESLFARRSPLWSAFLMTAVGFQLVQSSQTLEIEVGAEQGPAENRLGKSAVAESV